MSSQNHFKVTLQDSHLSLDPNTDTMELPSWEVLQTAEPESATSDEEDQLSHTPPTTNKSPPATSRKRKISSPFEASRSRATKFPRTRTVSGSAADHQPEPAAQQRSDRLEVRFSTDPSIQDSPSRKGLPHFPARGKAYGCVDYSTHVWDSTKIPLQTKETLPGSNMIDSSSFATTDAQVSLEPSPEDRHAGGELVPDVGSSQLGIAYMPINAASDPGLSGPSNISEVSTPSRVEMQAESVGDQRPHLSLPAPDIREPAVASKKAKLRSAPTSAHGATTRASAARNARDDFDKVLGAKPLICEILPKPHNIYTLSDKQITQLLYNFSPPPQTGPQSTVSKQTTHDPAPRRKVYTVPRWSRDGEMHLRLTSLFGPDYAEKATKAPVNSEITDAGGRVGRSKDSETEPQGLS